VAIDFEFAVRYSDEGNGAEKRDGREAASRDAAGARDAGGTFSSWIVAFIL
jgi:hypothetical protein